ncbi:MAG: hypothetical protein ACK528_09010, partial [Alphaproteobacteria bacterium]
MVLEFLGFLVLGACGAGLVFGSFANFFGYLVPSQYVGATNSFEVGGSKELVVLATNGGRVSWRAELRLR